MSPKMHFLGKNPAHTGLYSWPWPLTTATDGHQAFLLHEPIGQQVHDMP